jgi:hypothetical protein
MVISCGCAVDETPLEDFEQDAAAVEDPVGAMQQHLQQQFVAQQGQQEQPQLLGQEQQQQQPQLLGQEQQGQQQHDGFDALKQQMLEPQQQLQRELQQGVQQAAADSGPSSSSSSTQSDSSALSPADKVNPQQLQVAEGKRSESMIQRSNGSSSSSVRAMSGSSDLRGPAAAGSSNGAVADGGYSVMSWDLDETSNSSSSSSSSDLLPSKGSFDRLQAIR